MNQAAAAVQEEYRAVVTEWTAALDDSNMRVACCLTQYGWSVRLVLPSIPVNVDET